MNIKNVLKGVVVASTVGLLFTACGGNDSDTNDPNNKTAEIKCQGINDCAGHSDCSGATNDCKGLNDCKGQGYLLVETEQECSDQGGTVI